MRSERRLCEEVHVNLAYRWFCRLGLEDQVPNHSTFSKNRHGRFRDCELFRFVFESAVERCMDKGLIGGEGFAVDASIIKADAHRARGFPGKEGVEWKRAGRKTRIVREYLAALGNDEQAVQAHEATRKAISLTDDPSACWTPAPPGAGVLCVLNELSHRRQLSDYPRGGSLTGDAERRGRSGPHPD